MILSITLGICTCTEEFNPVNGITAPCTEVLITLPLTGATPAVTMHK